jgi:hypothetical protein
MQAAGTEGSHLEVHWHPLLLPLLLCHCRLLLLPLSACAAAGLLAAFCAASNCSAK